MMQGGIKKLLVVVYFLAASAVGVLVSTSVFAETPTKTASASQQEPDPNDPEVQATNNDPETTGIGLKSTDKQVQGETKTSSTDSSDTADADLPESNTPLITDPYEPFNRAMFTFNDKIDKYFLKPIATVYNKIMPKPLNVGVHNFFNNIGTIPTIINDLLQFHFYQMTNDLWRLGINTTVGVGGFFDMATRMKLPFYINDFGLTLATWGYKNSNYIVLPFFGPNTIRDGVGIPVDYYAFSVYPHIQPPSLRYQIYAVGIVDRRAQLLQYQKVFEEATYDEYLFMRNAYLQRRNYQIEQNAHRGYQDQCAQLGGADMTSTTATQNEESDEKDNNTDQNHTLKDNDRDDTGDAGDADDSNDDTDNYDNV